MRLRSVRRSLLVTQRASDFAVIHVALCCLGSGERNLRRRGGARTHRIPVWGVAVIENSRSRDSFCDGSIACCSTSKQSPRFIDLLTVPLADGASQPFWVGRGLMIGGQNDTIGHALQKNMPEIDMKLRPLRFRIVDAATISRVISASYLNPAAANTSIQYACSLQLT